MFPLWSLTFTAVTRVRIPPGTPRIQSSYRMCPVRFFASGDELVTKDGISSCGKFWEPRMWRRFGCDAECHNDPGEACFLAGPRSRLLAPIRPACVLSSPQTFFHKTLDVFDDEAPSSRDAQSFSLLSALRCIRISFS